RNRRPSRQAVRPAPLPPPRAAAALRLPGPGGCGYPDYFAPPPMSRRRRRRRRRRRPPLTPTDGRLARSISGHLAGLHGPPPEVSRAVPGGSAAPVASTARYLDLAGSARREASDALRRCYDDEENNERIIRATVQEAFSLAKLTFREYKSRVRTQLLLSHTGPASLDEAVQDFINCHHQPEDLQGMTEDVIRALTRDNRLYLPPGISYDVIGPFIRAACQLAWEMATLAQPLELAWCRDGEVFDEKNSLRPLVAHYTWPALVQGSEVVARGEACTRRGAATSSTEAIDLSGGLNCHQLHRHPHHTGYHGNRPSQTGVEYCRQRRFDSYSSLALLLLLWRPEHTTVLNPRCAIPLSCLATPTSDSDEDEEETSGSGCKSPKQETANTANQSNSNSNPNPASVASDYELGVRWNVDLLALKRRLMVTGYMGLPLATSGIIVNNS
uniref:Mitochondria-eating protein n=1 Tax=Macrostomum lignano TaxID=282301 RepID=A0A1I8JS62_9PLAT